MKINNNKQQSKRVLVIVLLIILFTKNIFAQSVIDTAAIKRQLGEIHDRDQKTRAHGDSAQFMNYIDSTNLIYTETLIKKYGWPGKSLVGANGNNTVFLVVQHAGLKTQEKYLPMLIQSVADSESRACDLALLQDRILMRQKKKQLYGSQIVPDNETGGWKFYPIEDEKNVNERRKKAGLESIEEYATYFGIEYKFVEK